MINIYCLYYFVTNNFILVSLFCLWACQYFLIANRGPDGWEVWGWKRWRRWSQQVRDCCWSQGKGREPAALRTVNVTARSREREDISCLISVAGTEPSHSPGNTGTESLASPPPSPAGRKTWRGGRRDCSNCGRNGSWMLPSLHSQLGFVSSKTAGIWRER